MLQSYVRLHVIGANGSSASNGHRFLSLPALCLSALLSVLILTFPAISRAALPDNRVYEQVSPVDKNGADVEPNISMAAVDGNRLYFISKGSFAGQPTALSAEATGYLATRGSGSWTTEGIAMPGGALSFGSAGYQGFNPDLSKGAILWEEDTRTGPYDPAAQPGSNVYLRDTETGSFQLLNGTLSQTNNDHGFVWATPDFSLVALDTNRALTPDAPCDASDAFEHCAYEWDNGDLRLASILPNGEPVKGSVGNRPTECNFENAVSEDGKRLFFSVAARNEEGLREENLYVRENGETTHLISASERLLPGGSGGEKLSFQTAEAAHGDKVLFVTSRSLLDADTNSSFDLYLYDFTKFPGERLTLVSEDRDPTAPEGAAVPAEYIGGGGASLECAGLVAASDDLRRVYFLASNQIVPGGPTAPGPKLYLWDDTGASPEVTYVGTLNNSDHSSGSSVAGFPTVKYRHGIPRQSRWSRDGRFLAFLASAQLTAFDNEGAKEIYLYDAVTGSLECASCSSDRFPAKGEIFFNEHFVYARPVNHMPTNVSDSGQVFFHTTRGLVPKDSNGKRDVYEYANGQLYLISKGTGDSDSTFLDATPTGSDVFFATRDRLVGWDEDTNLDAYDARVDGGLPEPPPGPPPCEGDSCQPPPVVPNDPTPASSSFSGAGNLTPPRRPRCKAGKVRRNGKCRKRRGTAAKRHRAAGKQATRSNG